MSTDVSLSPHTTSSHVSQFRSPVCDWEDCYGGKLQPAGSSFHFPSCTVLNHCCWTGRRFSSFLTLDMMLFLSPMQAVLLFCHDSRKRRSDWPMRLECSDRAQANPREKGRLRETLVEDFGRPLSGMPLLGCFDGFLSEALRGIRQVPSNRM